MNKARGFIFSMLVIALLSISTAQGSDDNHDSDSDSDSENTRSSEAVFVDVSVASPGVGRRGLAEFRLVHIVEEGDVQLFEDGKTYFAYKKANDNMLALATWAVTHSYMLTVALDPNAVDKDAVVYEMFLAGPLE